MNVVIVYNGVFLFLICFVVLIFVVLKCLFMFEKYVKWYCSINFGDMNILWIVVFDVVLRLWKGNCGMLLNVYFVRV